MRPDASENSQINPSTIVRAARAAGSQPYLPSGFQGRCKIATLHAGFGVTRGMSELFRYGSLHAKQGRWGDHESPFLGNRLAVRDRPIHGSVRTCGTRAASARWDQSPEKWQLRRWGYPY